MDNIGFIKIYRKILEWEWYDDIPTKVLFFHLLLKANFEKGRRKGIEINRGELISGRIALANESGLSEQQVRTCLKKLEKSGEITSKTTNKFSIIKLNNYDEYQQNNQQITSNQPTNNQQITNNQPQYKNNKNNKEEKEIILSNDSTTNVENKFGNEEINKMQNFIKEKLEENNLIYTPGKNERARIKNILTAKNFGEICKKHNMSRYEFVGIIINISSKLNYCKPINNGTDFYYNYVDVYNKAVRMKTDKELIKKRNITFG